mmetsp:Transcript_32885/g.50282  ORF Transcript_32885/g.50282 Transcript_32885/m.50282 type:complete len:101 (-) Transcript_32885:474-776(-)
MAKFLSSPRQLLTDEMISPEDPRLYGGDENSAIRATSEVKLSFLESNSFVAILFASSVILILIVYFLKKCWAARQKSLRRSKNRMNQKKMHLESMAKLDL